MSETAWLRSKRALAAIAMVVLSGLVLPAHGAAARQTATLVSIPRAEAVVATSPYAPRPPESEPPWGDDWCGLRYHEYWPTAACGGVRLTIQLNLGFNYSYQERANPNEYYSGGATADARVQHTYGCVNPTTGKTRRTVNIVERRPLDAVYYLTQLHDESGGFFTPSWYVNLRPANGAEGLDGPGGSRARLYCGDDESPIQLSVTFSAVRVHLKVVRTTWTLGPVATRDETSTTVIDQTLHVDGRWKAEAPG